MLTPIECELHQIRLCFDYRQEAQNACINLGSDYCTQFYTTKNRTVGIRQWRFTAVGYNISSYSLKAIDYLRSADLLPSFLSRFRPGHSLYGNRCPAGTFWHSWGRRQWWHCSTGFLDLSVAFDTVDHAILCRRLQVSYGLGSPVLEWFRSYLYRRSQYVRRGIHRSPERGSHVAFHRGRC